MFFYDTRISKYVWYGRPYVHVDHVTHANRLLARAESDDLEHWSTERMILDTDADDADAWDLIDETAMRNGQTVANARDRAQTWQQITEGAVDDREQRPVIRGRNRQWYGVTVFPCGNLYLGLAWLYDLPSGEMWIELVRSADGIQWQREPQREPFIPAHPGTCSCTMSSPPVAVGDNLRIYYSHAARNHHGVTIPDVDVEPPGIRVRTMKRDRWIAYAAGTADAELVTEVLSHPKYLAVNADVADNGYIRAEILDPDGKPVPGFDFDISVPLTNTAGLELELAWESATALSELARDQIRLRLVARNARIYGITVA